MAIVIACTCGKRIRAKDEMAGRKARCPHCHALLVVPSSAHLPNSHRLRDEECRLSSSNAERTEFPLPPRSAQGSSRYVLETRRQRREQRPQIVVPLGGEISLEGCGDGATTKACPFCFERIDSRAKRCRHCRTWLILDPSVKIPIKCFPSWNVPFFLLLTGCLYQWFWMYRIFKELHARKATDVTPGRAIGYLFIPFYNFYWVFRVWYEVGRGVQNAYAAAQLDRPLTGVVWFASVSWIIATCLNLAVPLAGFPISLIGVSVSVWTIQYHMNRLGELEQCGGIDRGVYC